MQANEQQEGPKRILITGATSGIGLETALQLCSLGHHLVITSRTTAKAEEAISYVKAACEAAIITHVCVELSSFDSINSCLDQLRNQPPFDIIILNAGQMFPEKPITEHGLEATYQINYLSHYRLAKGLIAQAPAEHRMHFVMLSSILIKAITWPFWRIPTEDNWKKMVSEDRPSSGFREYAYSKYALTVLGCELEGDNITAVSVHPGNTVTPLASKITGPKRRFLSIFKFTLIPIKEAAANVVRAAMEPLPRGYFYKKDAVVKLPRPVLSPASGKLVVETSEEQLSTIVNK